MLACTPGSQLLVECLKLEQMLSKRRTCERRGGQGSRMRPMSVQGSKLCSVTKLGHGLALAPLASQGKVASFQSACVDQGFELPGESLWLPAFQVRFAMNRNCACRALVFVNLCKVMLDQLAPSEIEDSQTSGEEFLNATCCVALSQELGIPPVRFVNNRLAAGRGWVPPPRDTGGSFASGPVQVWGNRVLQACNHVPICWFCGGGRGNTLTRLIVHVPELSMCGAVKLLTP